MAEQQNLEGTVVVPDESTFKCDRSPPCPLTIQQKIAEFCEKEYGAPYAHFAALHARAHDFYKHLVAIGPDTATWSSAWACTVKEQRESENDAQRESRGKDWEFQEGKYIRWRNGGITLAIDRGAGKEISIPVFAGYFRPIRTVVVEGWTYFEVELEAGSPFTASADEILKRLERDGRVRNRKLGHDILVEVLNEMSRAAGKAYPTAGVYENQEGALQLCTTPVPVREEQLLAHQEIKDGLELEATPEDVQRYLDFLPFFHPYEVLPAAGLAAIAPAAYALRSRDVFVPHLFHWSHEHGLGKSTVASVFSRCLWGRKETSGPSINSEFRLAVALDSCCVPQCIEEGERVDLQRLGPMIKTSAERQIVAKRGTTMLTQIPYTSRALQFYTGNRFPARSGSQIARFLAPHFDSSQTHRREEQKPDLDALRQKLRPIGSILARQLVLEFPTLGALMLRIRDLEAAIAKEARGSLHDIRSPQMWAVVRIGLELWGSVAAAKGLKWQPPSIAEFAREVVLPVDAQTFEGEETIIAAFRSWFAGWKVQNTARVSVLENADRERWRHDADVKGRGEIWMEGSLQVGAKHVPGTFVTKPLVDWYNRFAQPDLQISSLRMLAIAAADEAGIPHSLVADSKGPRPQWFDSKKRVRAAFLPDPSEPEESGE
jgi:hypothetical protein